MAIPTATAFLVHLTLLSTFASAIPSPQIVPSSNRNLTITTPGGGAAANAAPPPPLALLCGKTDGQNPIDPSSWLILTSTPYSQDGLPSPLTPDQYAEIQALADQVSLQGTHFQHPATVNRKGTRAGVRLWDPQPVPPFRFLNKQVVDCLDGLFRAFEREERGGGVVLESQFWMGGAEGGKVVVEGRILLQGRGGLDGDVWGLEGNSTGGLDVAS